MWRSRSVAGLRAPTASTTSWPWAQHSMSRAVRNDLAPIDGPYQSIRRPSSRAAAARVSRRRVGAPGVEQVGRGQVAVERQVVDPARVGKELGYRLLERRRILDGGGGRAVEVRQVADLVGHRPPGARRGQPPLLLGQAGHDRIEGVLLGLQVGRHLVHVGHLVISPSPFVRAAAAQAPQHEVDHLVGRLLRR